jgi:hypothetical protein
MRKLLSTESGHDAKKKKERYTQLAQKRTNGMKIESRKEESKIALGALKSFKVSHSYHIPLLSKQCT